MKRALVLVLLAIASPVAANPSNPAFLGIAFQPTAPGMPGGMISSVTPDTPAARAGLQQGDIIESIDNDPVDVTTLNAHIVVHKPGDAIVLDILRDGRHLTLTAILTTRAEMFDRLLGKTLPDIELDDSESGHAVDLRKPSGHATVVTWYHPTNSGGGACIDPVPVVQDVVRRVSSIKGSSASVVGATYGESTSIAADRKRLGIPVAVTSSVDFSRVAIDECGRVFAMVIDCRGVVTFLTPIADGDDEDAALDELATAAAQADHRRR